MGEWKSACQSGGWTWLSKTQCVLCCIKADCVRPIHLWGTNRYWPKVPGNANQLVDSTTSCWETWLPFQQDGAPPHWHLAIRTFLKEHLPNRWINRAGQNDQVFCKWPPEITGPDRLWLFSFGGAWRTESMYLHYPQLWMSCRNVSLQLSTRSRRICCRESGPS